MQPTGAVGREFAKFKKMDVPKLPKKGIGYDKK